MPPLKPIFLSVHLSWGDSLKEKLLSTNSFFELSDKCMRNKCGNAVINRVR